MRSQPSGRGDSPVPNAECLLTLKEAADVLRLHPRTVRDNRASPGAARKPRKQADPRRSPEDSTESPGGGDWVVNRWFRARAPARSSASRWHLDTAPAGHQRRCAHPLPLPDSEVARCCSRGRDFLRQCRAPRDDDVVRQALTTDATRAVPDDHAMPAQMVPCDTTKVRGDWLQNLAVHVKLHRTEWRVVAIVLSSPNPVSASSVAKRLRLDYGLVKRVARELILWNILERTAGLTFQPDHTRWGPPRSREAA